MARVRGPGAYLVAVFALLLRPCRAYQCVSGSPCESVCSDGSLDADAVCLDTEFNSTAAGIGFQACVSCLLNSTAVDTAANVTDVEFGLLDLRFTLSLCMFGLPDERVSLSSPCQVTCAPLNASIAYNLTKTPAYTDARLDFCTAASVFDDTTINNCASCYSLIPEQLYVANFLQALHIACRDTPVAGDSFYPDAEAIFNETLISGPSTSISTGSHGGLHGLHLALAIALPIAGGILLTSAICCFCFVSMRRRRRRMAASGRMERVHEHEARIHNYSLDSKRDSKRGWRDQEPAREMSPITPSTVTTVAPLQWKTSQAQDSPKGIALGGHDFEKASSLRDSFHQADDVGPGNDQIQDPNLHEQYFGIAKDVGVDDASSPVAGTCDFSNYIVSPTSSTTTATFVGGASAGAGPGAGTAPEAAPGAHGLSVYDRIRAEHASRPGQPF